MHIAFLKEYVWPCEDIEKFEIGRKSDLRAQMQEENEEKVFEEAVVETEEQKEDLIQKNQLEKEVARFLKAPNFPKSFLTEFSKTSIFKVWLHQHSPAIARLSPLFGVQDQVSIWSENGDIYKGELKNGLKEGQGQLY